MACIYINQSINDLLYLASINNRMDGSIKIRSNLQRDEMNIQKTRFPRVIRLSGGLVGLPGRLGMRRGIHSLITASSF